MYIAKKLQVGDYVKDDLTGAITTIQRIDIDSNGNIGYFIDSELYGGGRHPWEITAIGDYHVN